MYSRELKVPVFTAEQLKSDQLKPVRVYNPLQFGVYNNIILLCFNNNYYCCLVWLQFEDYDRSNYFRPDPRLLIKDSTGSKTWPGFDRGHLVPAGNTFLQIIMYNTGQTLL